MSTLRSAIWRIAQSTTECDCAICTSCTGSGQAAARQPGSSPPARQQPASPAAARQPSSSPPAQQQPASPAAARQPASSPPAQQQIAGQAAARRPGSSPPARQQPASPAADHRPGSYVIYAPARAGAPAPRRSNVPACVRGRARRYCARARGLCGFGSAKVW